MHLQEVARIKERHQEELLMTQLKSHQQTMQEVGKEIHDNLGQKLTLASLYLHRAVRKNEHIKPEQIEEINAILEESLVDVRKLSTSLLKTNRESPSLQQLLKTDLERAKLLHGIDYRLTATSELPPISAFYTLSLYRIFQEFIQNSIKHANATCLDINVDADTTGLTLLCADNGSGFDPESIKRGNGIDNISRRVTDLNGTLKWNSEPQKGTRLFVFAPVF